MKSIVCVKTFFFVVAINATGSISEILHTSYVAGTWIDFTCVNNISGYHQWQQVYDGHLLVGNIPLQKSSVKTIFKLNVEKFDNNSKIQCLKNNNSLLIKYLNIDNNTRIKVSNENSSKRDEDLRIQIYSENTTVLFNCSEYVNLTKYVNIGLISTDNKIMTFNTTRTRNNFTKAYNGKTLVCLYYIVDSKDNHTVTITRFVRKKALLLYVDYWDNDVSAVVGDQQTRTIIISTAVAILIMVLLVILILCKKRYIKSKSDDKEVLKTDKVLYADLDILRQEGNYHLRDVKEESPYAVIIGEIRPKAGVGQN